MTVTATPTGLNGIKTNIMVKEIKVKKVLFDFDKRWITVQLNTGSKIHIVPCYESWQQYGGTEDELSYTMDIAEAFNDWLHGDNTKFLEYSIDL